MSDYRFSTFDIYKTGIYDFNNDKTISFDKFITGKGTWRKSVLKSLAKMDNADLNKFVNVYSKRFGIDKKDMAQEVYDITPKFKEQKDILYYDNKFYVSRTFRKYPILKAN